MTEATLQPSIAIPQRSALAPETTWNAKSVFPTLADWQNEYNALSETLPEISRYQGHLEDGPQTLQQALQARDALVERVNKVFMYAAMAHAVETTNQESALLESKAQGLYGRVLAALAFFDPELLAVGQPQLTQWMEQEPGLALYRQYFDNLFRKQEHVRSAEVEELLGMLADPFAGTTTTEGILTSGDFKFKPAVDSQERELPLNNATMNKILAGPDRAARRAAWENTMDLYLAYKNTLASNLTTSIKQNVFRMRARRHKSTLEASLFENNVPVQVFHNLIETFQKNLPTWHRFWALKHKVLGVETLEPYDVWAPLIATRPSVPFKQAVEWICAGLAPLGEEYVETVRRGCLQQRWVDIYPNMGKTAGAFSYGVYGTHPFIVMSYTNEVFSLSTLAHELGHSMHSYLSWKTQPSIYGDYSLFVAEVASNFHQAMVRSYLLEHNQDPAFQISLIEEAMANFYRYFLVMPTLARFELETHQQVERGEGLSSDRMNARMAELFREAFGPEMHVDTERMGITWATFGHLYSDYYVYQYATGISGAHALANRILSGQPGAAEDYLNFLKAGSSVYPLEALKLGGVDLASPQPVEETFQVMAEMVDRLEKLLGV